MNSYNYDTGKFKERLTKLRMEKGLSQEKLAGQFYMDRCTYSNYERTSRSTTPDLTTLAQLCQFYDVSADYLLFGIPSTMSDEGKRIEYLLNKCPDSKKQTVCEALEKIVSLCR